MVAKVGVVPLNDQNTKETFIKEEYLNAILDSNAIPYLIPRTLDFKLLDQVCTDMDGFLFTGGSDINPHLYGEKRKSFCGEISPTRDKQEIYMLNKLIKLDKPILAICRGCQLLNVAVGGTLFQDIVHQVPGIKLNHKQEEPYEVPIHKVKIKKDSKLFEAINKEIINVNTIHHQCIHEHSSNVKVTAISEDGLVEGIELKNKKFIVGVQWHPEKLFEVDKNSSNIFKLFIRYCEK